MVQLYPVTAFETVKVVIAKREFLAHLILEGIDDENENRAEWIDRQPCKRDQA